MAAVVRTKKSISYAQKIILQQRIHTIEFKERNEDLEGFHCAECHQMAIFNVQLECSHILCGDCFAKLHSKRCPATSCSMQVTPCQVQENGLEEALGELNVTCPNKTIGCPEVVRLRELIAHEECCRYSQQFNKDTKDSETCKQQILDLQQQLADLKMFVMQVQQTCGQLSSQMHNKIKEIVVEEIRMESAKEHLELENKLTGKFQHEIDNKMEVMRKKTEDTLQSKQEKDLENLEKRMLTRLHDNCDAIQEKISKHTLEKLCDDVERFKIQVESDLLIRTNSERELLEDKSKAFVKSVLDVECPAMEMRSFDKLMRRFQRYSDKMIGNVKLELNDQVKENVAKETNNLLENVKGVRLKCREEKEEIVRAFEKGLTEKCEQDEERMKNDLLRALYHFQLKDDVTSLSQAVIHLLPKSKTFIWDIGNFKDKLYDDELLIKSDIFHIPELGCKIRFSFTLTPRLCIEVNYLEQATDKVNPLNGHHRITFTLKHHKEDNKYKDVMKIFEPSFNHWTSSVLGYTPVLTIDELTFLHSRWLKNGKIEMRVTLEPLVHLVTAEPHQCESLIWKIDHYSDLCESFRYGRQCALSESFYSSEKGYRLKGDLYIGRGDVSFSLYFLKGPWDMDLPLKFKHRTTVCIISQDDEGQLKDWTFSKTSYSVTQDYFSNAISKADLKKYLKNDSLVISFKIEAL